MSPIVTGSVILGASLTFGFVGGMYSYAQRGLIQCDGADTNGSCGPTVDYYQHLLIPFVGPWMGVAHYAAQPRNAWFESLLLATLGLHQAAGLLTLVSGFLFQREEPVAGGTVAVSPTHRGHPGLDLTYRF